MDEKFVNKIQEDIGDKVLEVANPRERRIYILVNPGPHYSVSKYLFRNLECRLCTASAVEARENIEIIYHFYQDEDKCMINMKVPVSKETMNLRALGEYLPAARWIEREIWELFGVNFEGHPNMEHLILRKDWPEDKCPLRKDFDYEELKEQLQGKEYDSEEYKEDMK